MPRTGLTGLELKTKATDAALDRMRLVGFDRVRLSDVAKDIGVSHAALYSHFADKAALLDAVTERWMSEVEETLYAVTLLQGDAKERITSWFVLLYQIKRAKALDDPQPHQAFDVASAHEKVFVVGHIEALIGQVTGMFADLGTDFGTEEPGRNAALMYRATAAFHHPTMIAQLAKDDLESELRQIIQTMFLGMATR